MLICSLSCSGDKVVSVALNLCTKKRREEKEKSEHEKCFNKNDVKGTDESASFAERK